MYFGHIHDVGGAGDGVEGGGSKWSKILLKIFITLAKYIIVNKLSLFLFNFCIYSIRKAMQKVSLDFVLFSEVLCFIDSARNILAKDLFTLNIIT